MQKIITFAFLNIAGLVIANPASNIIKCSLTDDDCLKTSSQEALKYLAKGVPEYNVESLDPLFLDRVDADVAGLIYNFTNVKIDGYSNCIVKDIKLDLEKSSLRVGLDCSFHMTGDYVLTGRLIILPVEGQGPFSIKTEHILLNLDAAVNLVDGNDGRKHFNIKKFTFEAAAGGVVVYTFNNLFNGNKQLSDEVHKFSNENYREVLKEFSGPLFNAALKLIIKRTNKFMKNVPFDDLHL